MKKSIIERLKEERLYFDGGTGTALIEMGLPFGVGPEIWNIEAPEKIESLHRAYIAAGANIIKTNTFGVNSLKYENCEQLITRGIEIAIAASRDTDTYVAYDVGPLGRMLSPIGDLDFCEAVEIFKIGMLAADKAGADLILIETMTDAYETKAAVLAARESTQLPVFVTNVYDERGKLMTGADPEAMICMLEGLGVSAVGMNCSLGPDKMLPLVERFVKASSLPVIVNPNAGLPRSEGGRVVFDCDRGHFSIVMREIAALGAHLLGGCCGTTPEYIGDTVLSCRDVPYAPPTKKDVTAVSSYTHSVVFGDSPVLIGERINPTGKPKFKDALRRGDIGYIVSEALGEEAAGAEILDVNVGLPEICERDIMLRAIGEISAVCDLPLCIDSSDPETLGAAMRIYNGKPLVNSVNGKSEVMRAVFPQVKKYGGVVIALTLDEGGIPDNAEGRVKIAERIIDCAREYGIDKRDIIVDPLALSISSGQDSAAVALRAIELLSKKNIKTSLGVSNISFGLPARDKINSAFFLMAMQKGLSAAIINPYSAPMLDAYRAYRALAGLDIACREYIENNSDSAKAKENAPEVNMDLSYAVRHGLCDRAAELARAALSVYEPLEVINSLIIPALNEIGAEFEAGRAYLPELIMSAESAGLAFAEVKKKIPESNHTGRQVVLATVKGDIHDIGKNIVKVLLESYGFSVIDLGRDTAKEKILEAAASSGASLVGLSALMTTTVESMRETVELLKAELPSVKIMVGGAVLTQEYAERIGADYYGADAMEAVRIAEDVYGGES